MRPARFFSLFNCQTSEIQRLLKANLHFWQFTVFTLPEKYEINNIITIECKLNVF